MLKHTKAAAPHDEGVSAKAMALCWQEYTYEELSA